MTKHTPGPWIVQQPSSEDPELAIIGGGVVIADMYGVHDKPQANARLIAAAPMLLKFAEDVASGAVIGVLAVERAKALLVLVEGRM